MIIQFLVAMLAMMSFAIYYSVPKRNLLACALSGAIGWIIYYALREAGYETIIYCFVSAFVLTIFSRCSAVVLKTPVTMYLLPGIYPIVPGAGIYNTAYYFFMNDMTHFGISGLETLKAALAISFGIIFALAIPQKLFALLHYLQRNENA